MGIRQSSSTDFELSFVGLGIVTEGDNTQVVDRSKVRRNQSLVRKEIKKAAFTKTNEIKGIYFHEQKDQTLTNDRKGSNYRRNIISE